MKKITYSLLTLLTVTTLIFSGCGKEEKPAEPEAFLASTSQENRVALLEDFTGVRCGYCPDGHVRAKAAADANPGKFIIIATHANLYANPSATWADFTTTQGTAIDAQAKPAGYPAGTVNRMKCSDLGVAPMSANSAITMDRGKWAPAGAKVMTMPAPVNIGAKATFDAGSRVLTVKVDLYYTSDESGNNLNVSLLQDKLKAKQSNYTPGAANPTPDYEQNHVLRDMLTKGNFGEPITETTTTGSKITKTFTYTVPDSYKSTPVVTDDLKVVVYVTKGQLDVLNAYEVDVK
jgi:hypothetical protein